MTDKIDSGGNGNDNDEKLPAGSIKWLHKEHFESHGRPPNSKPSDERPPSPVHEQSDTTKGPSGIGNPQ